MKLPDDVEEAIEMKWKVDHLRRLRRAGKASRIVDAAGRHIVEFCKGTSPN